MMPRHWVMLIVILLIGYFIGVKFPATGTNVLAKVGI